MIESFAASWPLFHNSYLAAWILAFVLSLVGVWLVARDQIFLGVAVAQASTLGVAGALWAGGLGALGALHFLESDWAASALAVLASVGTALFTALRRSDRESSEAVTGWVFLVAASVPTLLLARDPHGLEEVHQLLFSTLIGATRADLVVLAALALGTAGLALRYQEPLRLLALDPEAAEAVGLRGRRWRGALALWLGLAVGLSIRISGTLYTFGCLVLPALAAKHFVRDVRGLLVAAPGVAVAAAVAGSILSNHFDTPPAHTSVAVLCAGVLLGWIAAARRT